MEARRHCVTIEEKDLFNMGTVLARLDELNPSPYDMYADDIGKICDQIMG